VEIGTHVAYKHDQRVTGIVVGFGTVDNAADPLADGDLTHRVAIVRLDGEPLRLDSIPAHISFHFPIDPHQLVPIVKEPADA
jgi:hypothetical protein